MSPRLRQWMHSPQQPGPAAVQPHGPKLGAGNRVAVFLGVPTPVPFTPGRTVAKDSPAHTSMQIWQCPKQLTGHQARMLEPDTLPQLP